MFLFSTHTHIPHDLGDRARQQTPAPHAIVLQRLFRVRRQSLLQATLHDRRGRGESRRAVRAQKAKAILGREARRDGEQLGGRARNRNDVQRAAAQPDAVLRVLLAQPRRNDRGGLRGKKEEARTQEKKPKQKSVTKDEFQAQLFAANSQPML